ncbi:MAG: response regulator [Methylobacter sp.]
MSGTETSSWIKIGKILAVDETPASLKLLTELFQSAGYEVRSAISGELAVHSAINNPPELMPVMDGFEVCRRFKAQPETRDVPIASAIARELQLPEDQIERLNLACVVHDYRQD